MTKMKGLITIILLVISNSFMTIAWYGHLKLSSISSKFQALPLLAVIALSWSVAFFEYLCQVPANRIGFIENGGPFTLLQLKIIQEVITLTIFTLFSLFIFKGFSFHWNNIAAFICLILAVYFTFMKN